MTAAEPSIVYRHLKGLYVNLTNSCPTACVFCVKHHWGMDYHGSDLNLHGNEPSPEEIISLAERHWKEEPFEEFVFCGYGEPTMRLDALLSCARQIRNGGAAPIPRNMRIRLNTNGLANAVWGRNVVADMAGLIDSVHVSLNTSDPQQWKDIMRPAQRWADTGFEKVKEFIREAARLLPETVATVIEGNGVDIVRFEELARELGAGPRVRPRLETEGSR